MKLLQDIVVLDFSQFLSGPSASLRLADMGAQVIKIEKKGTGDICRQLYVSDVMIEGESTIFHAINRNKQSYAADLKDENDVQKIKQLIAKADVMVHNFRPGVMKRLGLDYEEVKQINPQIIYGEVSGYGDDGPWKGLPGQDLLLQAISGLSWLSHNKDKKPTPTGVAVVDILTGTHLAQGLLAALYRRGVSGIGGLVQVSMLESILDFQFELLTCFYNDGGQLPQRSAISNGNAYIPAPYGIYTTSDSYMALAMGDIQLLGKILGCSALNAFQNKEEWFTRRDEIKNVLTDHLASQTTGYWLSLLEPAGIWCSEVMNYDKLMQKDAYKLLQMEMEVRTGAGYTLKTTRCPVRIDGKILHSALGAPVLGEHNAQIERQFSVTP